MIQAGQPMTWNDAALLAGALYPDYPGQTEQLFALLVDVADCYIAHLEHQPAAQMHPAPFIGGRTPMDAGLDGLRMSLEAKRDGRLPQHR